MIFTIDWEPYFCYRPYSSFWEETDPLVEEPTMYLLDLLRRHQIKATWYVLGWLKDKRQDLYDLILNEGHQIGGHTYYHSEQEAYEYAIHVTGNYDKGLFRAPRWKYQKRLYSGGFWFRYLPYFVSKKLLKHSSTFYIHPYDVLLEHPKTGSIRQDFKRQTGLKTVRDKLERLCREVEFSNEISSKN